MDQIEGLDCEFALLPKFSFDSPYLAEYFGIWSVYAPTFEAMVDKCNGIDLFAHIKSQEVQQSVESRDTRNYGVTRDGVALFDIRGAMMKSVPSMANGTSTTRVRQQVRAARRDPEVLGAIMRFDTPGGSVKGNMDLVADVAAFAAEKPLFAYVEDMAASAGVSVASQATKRFANTDSALYAGMGTYSVLLDQSGRAEKLGVRVLVVAADGGTFKGMGTDGSPITEEHVGEIRRIVNSYNSAYLQAIASGLNKSIEQIRPLADGRVHPASEAVKMGLIDGVQSFDQTYAELLQVIKSKRTSSIPRSMAMSEVTATKPAAASLAELKKTFPKSTADWREKQMEAGATIADAAVAFGTFLQEQLDEKEKAHQKALADQKTASDQALEAAKAAGQKPGGKLGHNPLKVTKPTVAADQDVDDVDQTGDPIEDFNALVVKAAGANPDAKRRIQAVAQVARKHPELHKQFLLASNPGARAKRIITEKAEIFAGAAN